MKAQVLSKRVFPAIAAMLFVVAFGSRVRSEESMTIYAVDLQRGLVQFDSSNMSVTPLNGLESGSVYQFSNDGRKVAFWNTAGLWISLLLDWNPVLVYGDRHETATNLTWTPDDTRILIRFSEGTEIRAFNLRNYNVETWPWGNCNQIGKNKVTQKLVLICSSDSQELSRIALSWGGDYVPFREKDFAFFELGNLSNSVSDWSYDGSAAVLLLRLGNDVVAMNETTSILREETVSPFPIFHTRLFETESLRISPNGEFVAVISRRGAQGIPQILQVFDMKNGVPLWVEPLQLDIRIAQDLEWSPDGSKLIALDFNYPDDFIAIVNLKEKRVTKYVVPGNELISIAVVDAE